MGKDDKLLVQVLSGKADANIGFSDLVRLLRGMGFEMCVSGRHHVQDGWG